MWLFPLKICFFFILWFKIQKIKNLNANCKIKFHNFLKLIEILKVTNKVKKIKQKLV